MKKTLLLIGAAGFLGRHIARYFSKTGWKIIGVDMVPRENAPLSELYKYYCMQLPNTIFEKIVIETKPQACINCAGRASVGNSMDNPNVDFQQGPVMTFYILNTLRKYASGCRFVFISSAAVYGNPEKLPVSEKQFSAPISPYGFHKWQSEIICREFSDVYDLAVTCVRIFSAYGSGLRRQVVWDICRKAISGDEIHLQGTGNESRDFIHATDVARGIEKVIENKKMGAEVYNLATGKQTTISDLASLIIRKMEVSQKKVYFDYKIPQGTPLNWQADISAINRLGFEPKISLEDGIETYAKWFNLEWRGV